MSRYVVRVVIANKPGMRDPEGETILSDLVLRSAKSGISHIGTAKMLIFHIESESEQAAADQVRRICDDLRIYNPAVSQISVDPAGTVD